MITDGMDFGQLQSLRKRLFSGLVIDPIGCLIWTRATSKDGYGRILVNGSARSVHIVMWEIFEGHVPAGLELDHVKSRGCRHRNCASIDHLEPVTRRENTMRGGSFSSINAAKTHCDSKHEFTPANTYIRPNGHRDCRACIRQRARKYKARKVAAEHATAALGGQP